MKYFWSDCSKRSCSTICWYKIPCFRYASQIILWLYTYNKWIDISPYLPSREVYLKMGKQKFHKTGNSFINKKFIEILKSWFLFKHQASMDIWIFLTCKMIPPHYISETHWWATGRVVFTFQRLMISPYHIH